MTYPLLKSMGYFIIKHLDILYMDGEVKLVSSPRPMFSFQSARKTNRYPVRARLYLLERTVDCFKCKANRCQVCLNVNATDNFFHKVNGKTYNIIQKFDCSAKCLTYLLTCQKCHKQIFWQNDRLVSTKMNQLQKQFPQLR